MINIVLFFLMLSIATTGVAWHFCYSKYFVYMDIPVIKRELLNTFATPLIIILLVLIPIILPIQIIRGILKYLRMKRS
jgi:hypothetical protein